MTLRSLATVALILIPSFAFAANGGGTGESNAGNGAPSGANSDASNANTPVGAKAGANAGSETEKPAGSLGASGTGKTDAPSTMGTSKDMKPQNGEPQKTP